MNSGSFSHVGRTSLKGAVFGALLGPTLAMLARGLFYVVVLTMQDGKVDVASVIVGYPAFVLQAILDSGMNGDLGVFALFGAVTGICAGLLTVWLPRRMNTSLVVALCAGLAVVLYACVALMNMVAGRLVVAPVIGVEGWQWAPIAVYVAMTAWIGWRLRRGSVA